MDLRDIKLCLVNMLEALHEMEPTFVDMPTAKLRHTMAWHAVSQLNDGIDAPGWDDPERVRFVSAHGGPWWNNPEAW